MIPNAHYYKRGTYDLKKVLSCLLFSHSFHVSWWYELPYIIQIKWAFLYEFKIFIAFLTCADCPICKWKGIYFYYCSTHQSPWTRSFSWIHAFLIPLIITMDCVSAFTNLSSFFAGLNCHLHHFFFSFCFFRCSSRHWFTWWTYCSFQALKAHATEGYEGSIVLLLKWSLSPCLPWKMMEKNRKVVGTLTNLYCSLIASGKVVRSTLYNTVLIDSYKNNQSMSSSWQY